jgi:hypothetical protein
MLSKCVGWQGGALVSGSKAVQFLSIQKEAKKGRRAMARFDFGYLPHENPCAQCGKPIAVPEWIEEESSRRISFLWHCWACDYRFEAVAVFDEQRSGSEALAA